MSGITLASFTFNGTHCHQSKFQLLKQSIERTVGYHGQMCELSEEELSFLKGFEDNEIDWFMDCDLLVDKGKIDIKILGLVVGQKEYEMGDELIDEEGNVVNYWLDITVTCNNQNAVVNLNEYPLLTFLKNEDKDDGSARRDAYKAAVKKDETGLIQREFGADFERAEYRYYVHGHSE